MILPRMIRKLLAVFRGGVSPVLIVLSIFMGCWFGLIPGFSGFHIILILLTLILNIHIGLFLLSMILCRGLCIAAAPLLYHTGLWARANISFLFRFLESIPIIGLTDFNRYAVAGAFILGPVIGIIAGLLMAMSVIKFRKTMFKLEEGSEKFRKWYSNPWVRILDRILIGKRAKDFKSIFTAKTKYIRKAGVALAVIVIAISIAITVVFKDSTIKNSVTKAMTRANGAEVNLEELDISLLNGAISAAGIQVTDPENLANNQFSVDTIAADASVYNLLLGKAVMEKLQISNVRFDQPRSSPGKPFESGAVTETDEPDPNETAGGVLDYAKIDQYIKDAQAWKEKLRKIRKYLPSGKDKTDKPAETPREIPQKYLDFLNARAAVAITPKVMAQQVILDKVQIPSSVFGNSDIEMTNLSDSPQAAALPITFDLNSLDTGAAIKMTADFSLQPTMFAGSFSGIDMSKFQSSLSSDAGLDFQSGTLSGTFTGTATKEALDISIDIDISNLQAEGTGDGVLGFGRDTTSEIFSILKELSTTIKIVGSPAEPRLVFDVEGLTEDFKQAAIDAGRERLMQEIDDQLGEELEQINEEIEEYIPDDLGEQLPEGIGEQLPDQIRDVIEEPNNILEDIGGLFNR